MTEAELRLWFYLRRSQIPGSRFRRQHPIGPFIADFVCLRSKLIVEVDGSQHGDRRRLHDERRDAWLQSRGYRVLRFWNHDVFRNIDSVIDTIAHATADPRS